MYRVLFVFSVLCLALGSSASSDSRTFARHGAWEVTVDENRRCTMSRLSEHQDSYVLFSLSKDDANTVFWQLGFVHRSWTDLPVGKPYPVELSIDESGWKDAALADVRLKNLIFFRITDVSKFAVALKQGGTMRLATARDTYPMPLVGSSGALASLLDCIRANAARKDPGNPFKDPFTDPFE